MINKFGRMLVFNLTDCIYIDGKLILFKRSNDKDANINGNPQFSI